MVGMKFIYFIENMKNMLRINLCFLFLIFSDIYAELKCSTGMPKTGML